MDETRGKLRVTPQKAVSARARRANLQLACGRQAIVHGLRLDGVAPRPLRWRREAYPIVLLAVPKSLYIDRFSIWPGESGRNRNVDVRRVTIVDYDAAIPTQTAK
jgi:hypothetical protein